MVLAISGACARLGGISCAAAFMLGFDTLLRPGEFYKVPKRDITWAGGRAVLTLKHTKTGQRKATQEMAICHSQIANLWVSRALANKAGSDLLLDCFPQALRALFSLLLSTWISKDSSPCAVYVVGEPHGIFCCVAAWRQHYFVDGGFPPPRHVYTFKAAATLAHLQITPTQTAYMHWLAHTLMA